MEADGWRLEGVLRPLGGRERSFSAFRPGGGWSPYLGGQCWAPSWSLIMIFRVPSIFSALVELI